MVDVTTFTFSTWTVRGSYIDKNGHKKSGNFHNYVDCPEMVIIQYTGLKDKNGKEIYEGDIVGFKRKEILHTLHHSVVEWDDMKAGFFLTRVHMFPKKQDSSIRNEFINAKNKEVIGNIYENPELLKKEA